MVVPRQPTRQPAVPASGNRGFSSLFSEEWRLFKDSINVLLKKPVLAAPLFFSWFIFASLILYFRYYFEFPSSILLGFFYVYLLIFTISFVLCAANLILLELVQQIESGKETSLSGAIKETISFDLLKALPIAIIWVLVWFVLLLLQAARSVWRRRRKRRHFHDWFILLLLQAARSKEKEGKRPEPSVQDAARTLGGADSGPFSWFNLGLNMLEKLIRMAVFLALPAIAWENKGAFSSLGRSFELIKKHPVQFMAAYTLTAFAAVLMTLPILPIIYLDDSGFSLPAIVWTLLLIYEAMVWTLGIYLEQMSVGLLYLWHLKWEKKGGKGELSDVQKPDLLDDISELK